MTERLKIPCSWKTYKEFAKPRKNVLPTNVERLHYIGTTFSSRGLKTATLLTKRLGYLILKSSLK